MTGRYRSGRQEPPEAGIAAALADLLDALGFRAMSQQCRDERDEERLRLYARIILKQAPPDRRGAILERIDRLGIL